MSFKLVVDANGDISVATKGTAVLRNGFSKVINIQACSLVGVTFLEVVNTKNKVTSGYIKIPSEDFELLAKHFLLSRQPKIKSILSNLLGDFRKLKEGTWDGSEEGCDASMEAIEKLAKLLGIEEL
jgi:hypothetical protein